MNSVWTFNQHLRYLYQVFDSVIWLCVINLTQEGERVNERVNGVVVTEFDFPLPFKLCWTPVPFELDSFFSSPKHRLTLCIVQQENVPLNAMYIQGLQQLLRLASKIMITRALSANRKEILVFTLTGNIRYMILNM